MIAYEDPSHPGNGPKYLTGKPCMNSECDREAGTAWSPYWCFECNVKRIKEIDHQLNALIEAKIQGPWPLPEDAVIDPPGEEA